MQEGNGVHKDLMTTWQLLIAVYRVSATTELFGLEQFVAVLDILALT